MGGRLVKPPPSPDRSDQSLLDHASVGDQDAFEALVHCYQQVLLMFTFVDDLAGLAAKYNVLLQEFLAPEESQA